MQDHCGKENFTKHQQVRSCAFNKNKAKNMPHISMHLRAREHNTLDLTIQQNLGWLSQGRRTSRHGLHPLLRRGHKTRHSEFLNTGKILKSGESGKTKSGGRKGKG